MQKLKEQIIPIKGYEDLYAISNYGYVISLPKERILPHGGIVKKLEIVLKPSLDKVGYLSVGLSKNGSQKTFRIHHLVWDTFGNKPRNGRKLQIDHKNNVKTNNRIDNLQLLTARENTIKYHKTQRSLSKYTGVTWFKDRNKWGAQIGINNKNKHIGFFTTEYDAHLAYEKAKYNLNILQDITTT